MCREYTLQDNGHLSDIYRTLSDIFCFGVCPISDVFTAPPPPYSTSAPASHNTLAPNSARTPSPEGKSFLADLRLRLPRAVDRLPRPADVAPAEFDSHPGKRPRVKHSGERPDIVCTTGRIRSTRTTQPQSPAKAKSEHLEKRCSKGTVDPAPAGAVGRSCLPAERKDIVSAGTRHSTRVIIWHIVASVHNYK